MTHPVKLDELLERFEFVPHEGSPHARHYFHHNWEKRTLWGFLDAPAYRNVSLRIHESARAAFFMRCERFNQGLHK